MNHLIGDQHFKHLQRQAERAAFMWAVLDARMRTTNSPDLREFTEYLLSSVDKAYPEVPLQTEEAA